MEAIQISSTSTTSAVATLCPKDQVGLTKHVLPEYYEQLHNRVVLRSEPSNVPTCYPYQVLVVFQTTS